MPQYFTIGIPAKTITSSHNKAHLYFPSFDNEGLNCSKSDTYLAKKSYKAQKDQRAYTRRERVHKG